MAGRAEVVVNLQDKFGLYLDAGIASARTHSPCVRRRYCAQIICVGPFVGVVGWNTRESRACTEMMCARDRFEARHGQQVEICGEIHAEQSALINHSIFDKEFTWYFLLSGWEENLGRELLGREVYPCHVCALMIKHAGFESVVLRDDNRDIAYVSIAQIIEEREQEWEKP